MLIAFSKAKDVYNQANQPMIAFKFFLKTMPKACASDINI